MGEAWTPHRTAARIHRHMPACISCHAIDEQVDATLDRERERLRASEANAKFLLDSIGECHLMISRETPEFQTRQEWDATSLPARLQKFMRDARASEAARVKLVEQLDDYHRAWDTENERRHEAEAALADARAALGKIAAIPKQPTGHTGSTHYVIVVNAMTAVAEEALAPRQANDD